MKVHYPKLYKMAHLFTFNAFTDFKGSNNYILFMILNMYLSYLGINIPRTMFTGCVMVRLTPGK